MIEAPVSAVVNNLIDRLKEKSNSLQLFGSARLTPHQYMRNFAISVGIEFLIIPAAVVLAFVFGIASIMDGHSARDAIDILKPIYFILAVGFVILAVAIQLYAAAQRFHDMGKPGNRAFLLFIPFYNLYVFYVLITKKTVQEPNQFGPVPEEVQNKRKIEIWFVIAWLLVILSGVL